MLRAGWLLAALRSGSPVPCRWSRVLLPTGSKTPCSQGSDLISCCSLSVSCLSFSLMAPPLSTVQVHFKCHLLEDPFLTILLLYDSLESYPALRSLDHVSSFAVFPFFLLSGSPTPMPPKYKLPHFVCLVLTVLPDQALWLNGWMSE